MLQLANKYRPKKLEDVVGQEVPVKILSNSIERNKLAQAYLMVGQFGSGKTTVARILAASENCVNNDGPTLYPCGKCDLCIAVFEGNHTDIQEIDAASAAGKVDETRKLKKDALYKPVDGARSKVFIIDEAHRMSDAAAESLLKILEEPPSHVRFILCTTDVQKLRPAIQSRCQRHDFGKIYWSLMSEHLQRIAKQESVDVDIAAVNLCAKLAKGSMRSALNNLDKLIDFVDGKITIDDAQKVFSAGDESSYFDLIDQIIGIKDGKPDASEGIRIISKMLAQGADFNSVYTGLAEHMNMLTIGLTSSKAGEFLNVSEEGKSRLKEQLKKCQQGKKLPAVLMSIRNLHDTKRSFDLNIPPEICLETWLVESIFAFRR